MGQLSCNDHDKLSFNALSKAVFASILSSAALTSSDMNDVPLSSIDRPARSELRSDPTMEDGGVEQFDSEESLELTEECSEVVGKSLDANMLRRAR